MTEAVASASEKDENLQQQAFEATVACLLVTASDHSGAEFEPATFGL